MRRIASSLPLLVLLTLFPLVAEVRADQVRFVTSGFFDQRSFFGDDFISNWSSKGSEFAISGHSPDHFGLTPPCYRGCAPGEVLDLIFVAESVLHFPSSSDRAQQRYFSSAKV